MRRMLAVAAALVLGLGAAQSAHAIQVSQSVQTSAAPDKVWAVIQDFGGFATWHPAAASSPATKGNTVGSVRVITLKAPGDPTVTEKLTRYDATKHRYSYTIMKVDPKVIPVVHYRSTLAVLRDGTGSKVTWQGTFGAAHGVHDADAAKAITGVYRGGLDNIKTLAEKP